MIDIIKITYETNWIKAAWDLAINYIINKNNVITSVWYKSV